MIDRYTRERFEAALPVVGGQPLWTSIGLRDGEHCYIVPVAPGVLIYVRSTVQRDGLAADVAKDSIRCWLASDDAGTSLGSKDVRWIARTSGWDRRMTETLRALWRLGRKLKPCGRCGRTMSAVKTKSGPNTGRWFMKCFPCDQFAGWLTEKEN